jgi:short-subunit dehydrogenase
VTGKGVAIVTGASAGIGREFCDQLAARGHDLLVVARDGERLRALAAELSARHGVAVTVHRADLSHEPDIEDLAERLGAGVPPALLVNNAGFGTRGTLLEADPVRQAAMVRLHTLAPMRLTMAVLPGMVRAGAGSVVNVSSVASFVYSAGNVNYCATKAYLTNFTEGVAAELRGTGVLAQALCPGFTRTEFHQRMEATSSGLPGVPWMTSRSVVQASLAALDRGGPVICVPGVAYKVMVRLARLAPRRVLGWAAALRRGRV